MNYFKYLIFLVIFAFLKCNIYCDGLAVNKDLIVFARGVSHTSYVSLHNCRTQKRYFMNDLKEATEWELRNLKGIIYKFTNKINGKVYIGQSKNSFQVRYGNDPEKWYKKTSNLYFKRALLKYGYKAFSVEILQRKCPLSFLNIMEPYYIIKYKSSHPESGYNQKYGGKNRSLTDRQRKEAQERFIEKSKNIHNNKYNYDQVKYENCKSKVIIFCKSCNLEFLQQPSNHLSGKGCRHCRTKKSGELNRSNWQEFLKKSVTIYNHEFEYIFLPEPYSNARVKIGIKHKKCGYIFYQLAETHLRNRKGCPNCGNFWSPERPVEQIDLKTNIVINIFPSIAEARRRLGVKGHNIEAVCRGKRNECEGFFWKYIN